MLIKNDDITYNYINEISSILIKNNNKKTNK